MKRPAITQAMKLAVLQREGLAPCYRCGSITFVSEMHFEHEQALVDDGAHHPSNIRMCCIPCHMQKTGREIHANAKAKRLAKAREAHEAILRGEPKPPGSIKSRGFDKTYRKRMNGEVVRRTP